MCIEIRFSRSIVLLWYRNKFLLPMVFSVLLLLFNLPQADADLCGDTVFLKVLNDDTGATVFDGSGVVPWNPSPGLIQIAPFVQIDVRVFCDGDDGLLDGQSTIFFDYVTAPTGPDPFPVPNHSFWFTDLEWTNAAGEVVDFTVGSGNHQTPSLMTTGFGPGEAHATTGAFNINPGTSMLNDLFITAAHNGNGNAVGGEFIGIDSTMVLAAGAQYTAAWMIPVIVSGIGFAIVIARKF